ncbi:hypothetical protein ACFOEK_19905 [Litoribrevibacter euphylliae]|uniref:Uncharacterized protein n=1 Tax=Litoribrevibacter euphylliae TaxID=1834034 RepID=A0ABV7HHH6_9GAMM
MNKARIKWIAFRSLVCCSLMAIASINFADEDHLRMMVLGNYLLIGKSPDSTQTYYGKIQIHSEGDAMAVVRDIDGVITKGTAAIEPALAGDARVLRIRFTESGVYYEETCLISSDLDNYARISCYLYQPYIQTDNPGLEALFYDHNAN